MTKASMSLDKTFQESPPLWQAGADGPRFPLDCCLIATRPDCQAPNWPSMTRARGHEAEEGSATRRNCSQKCLRGLVSKQLSLQWWWGTRRDTMSFLSPAILSDSGPRKHSDLTPGHREGTWPREVQQ